MRRLYYLSLLFIVIVIVQSCDIYNDTGYEERYVIEAYLVDDRPLPPVRISHTVPADEIYRFSNTAVAGADVSISQLDADGSVEQRITYSADSAGVYSPDQSLIVQARHTYRLEAQIDEEHTVTATTTVPNSYQLKGTVADSVRYQVDPQIEIDLIPDQPDTASRQKQFVFNLIAENYEKAPLTPFYQDQLDGDETARSDFRNNSSGLVTEGNFDLRDDGSIRIWVPWIGFAFYGPNKIVTNSIDENLYDFIRTQGIQTGGSTLSPGEIPNVIYNVDGGIGIFASMSTDTLSTYLLPPPSNGP